MTVTRHRFTAAPPKHLGPGHRLAVYGSLAPGESNAHILAPLVGSWCDGITAGTLHTVGWGYALGHRAIRLDPHGPDVPVKLFSSRDLPAFWNELDAFEGEEYERTVTQVQVGGRVYKANIYRWREPG